MTERESERKIEEIILDVAVKYKLTNAELCEVYRELKTRVKLLCMGMTVNKAD